MIKNKFFLTFKDPQDQELYNKSRQKDIIKISSLLCLARIAYVLIILVNYLSRGAPTAEMVYLIAIGVAIQLVMIIPLFWYTGFVQYIHAPIVVLSFQTYLFYETESISYEGISLIIGRQVIIAMTVSFLNQVWLLTSTALFLTFGSTVAYLGGELGLYIGDILPQEVVFFTTLSYFAFYCE